MDLSLNIRAFIAQRLIPRRDGRGCVPAVEVSQLAADFDLVFKGDVSGHQGNHEKVARAGDGDVRPVALRPYEAGLITYEDALRNADSLNDLRLEIKLHGKEARTATSSGIGNLDRVPDAEQYYRKLQLRAQFVPVEA
jgi:twitching motility protein PilU